MIYLPQPHRLFRVNISSVRTTDIIFSKPKDDVLFYYSTGTAVPQAVTISMLPLPPTVS